jgi:hypothetical protein
MPSHAQLMPCPPLVFEVQLAANHPPSPLKSPKSGISKLPRAMHGQHREEPMPLNVDRRSRRIDGNRKFTHSGLQSAALCLSAI